MSLSSLEPAHLYAKDSNLKKKDVEILQEWLKKQPHLPQPLETQLLVFLHSCYYKIELTKTTIDNYFTCRTLCPEIFQAMTPENLKITTKVAYVDLLPATTPEGYGILLFKLLDTKAENFNCTNIVNLVVMVCTLYLHKKGFDNGAIAIFDAKGASLGHVTRINLNVIKHALYFVQEAAPVRIKGIHVINSIPLIDKVVALVKPFLKSELYNMLQFHPPGSDSLYKTVPKDVLPEDYGGKSPSIQVLNEASVKLLLDHYDFYDWHHNSQKVDETKRMGKSKAASEIFGLDGTFKKLELD